MILHCLQWYNLLLRTRLSTPAVQYLVRTNESLRIRPEIFVTRYTSVKRSLNESCQFVVDHTV